MRSIVGALGAIAVTVTMAACGSAGEPAADAAKGTTTTATTAASAAQPSWLLVLRGASGTYRADGPTGTLVVHDVDRTYLAFTDRPDRQTRRDTVEALVANWDASFSGSAPNAAVSLDEVAADGDTLILTLGKPTLGPDGTLTFPTTTVPETDGTLASRVGRGADRSLPASFGAVSLFVDADLGYRSIEVVVTNDTPGNLMAQSSTVSAGATWIVGEQASQGAALNQYNAAKWGVETNDINASASGQISLAGLGSYPVTIQFTNSATGASSANVNGNDIVRGLVTQQDTGESNHTLYMIQLIPN